MPQPKRRKRVIFLGRQVKSKGIGDLIEAMRLVWPKHPDAELAIAGIRVPESSEVDAHISALPPSDQARIVQCGTVTDKEKSNLLQSAAMSRIAVKNRVAWNGHSRRLGAREACRHVGSSGVPSTSMTA